MDQLDLVNLATQIANDAGYSGHDALVSYAAETIPWLKKDKNEFIAGTELLSEEQTIVLQALHHYGKVIQPMEGAYRNAYFSSTQLSEHILRARNERVQEKKQQLANRAHTSASQKGYPSPISYAAMEIPWRKHHSRHNGFVAHKEDLSEEQMEILQALRLSGNIHPEDQDRYYPKDYVAKGELLTTLRGIQANIQEARSLVRSPRSR